MPAFSKPRDKLPFHESEVFSMYRHINKHADALAGKLHESGHFSKYLALRNMFHDVADVSTNEAFQREYRTFWSMNVARLDNRYMEAHFKFLQAHRNATKVPEVRQVAEALYEMPTRSDGKRTLQFSFASKLVHMLDPHQPVYDRLVEQFFFFPVSSLSGMKRLPSLCASYAFLQQEHARILRDGLLAEAIGTIKDRYFAVSITEEKIIDSLIWGFVDELNKGAIQTGHVVFSNA